MVSWDVWAQGSCDALKFPGMMTSRKEERPRVGVGAMGGREKGETLAESQCRGLEASSHHV